MSGNVFGPAGLNAPVDGLQLDRAEPLQSSLEERRCERCQNTIEGAHYIVNGEIHCPSCKELRESEPVPRPDVRVLARATLFGLGAAALGTIIYFAVLALSGYEIGWIAVIVGWLVGKAVKRGARGLTGRKLQIIAVALTYCSIVASYIPLVIKSAIEQAEKKDAAVTGAAKTGGAAEAPKAVGSESAGQTALGLVVGLAALFVFSLAIPFLAGFENILGVFIIAIGLFEAWKINRTMPLQIAGPFGAEAATATAP